MNKYLEPGAGCSETAVSYLECRSVGGKYICPYCNNVVPQNQGFIKGYTIHLRQVTFRTARDREAAAKVASRSGSSSNSSSIASGGGSG